MNRLIARSFVLGVALLAVSVQPLQAQCIGGSCQRQAVFHGGLAARPVLGAPVRVVERSVLRVRRVVGARPVRRVFAIRPVRRVAGALFGGCRGGRCH